MQTITGLFDDRADAENAVADLEARGIPRNAISIVARHYDTVVTNTGATETVKTPSHAASGAETGAVLGGLSGALLGATALLVPGVGPLLALGPILGYGLVGAGVGAAAGGVIGLLIDAGVPKEHAETYAEGLRRGGTLLTVQVGNEEQAEIARSVMRDHHVADIDQRASYYRSTGFTGYNPAAVPYTPEEARYERAQIRTMAPPVVVPQTRTAPVPNPPVLPTTDYHDYFRSHYNTTYARSGLTYDHFSPAYEFGYRLGSPAMYQPNWTDWSVVEPEAQRIWETSNPATWATYRDAIRTGWERSPARVGNARLI